MVNLSRVIEIISVEQVILNIVFDRIKQQWIIVSIDIFSIPYLFFCLALLPIKINNKISSSTSSINSIELDQGHRIRIDLRASSSQF
jgi:hypothetical protein